MSKKRKLDIAHDVCIGMDYALYLGPEWNLLPQEDRLDLVKTIMEKRPCWSRYDVAAFLESVTLEELGTLCSNHRIVTWVNPRTNAGKCLQYKDLRGTSAPPSTAPMDLPAPLAPVAQRLTRVVVVAAVSPGRPPGFRTPKNGGGGSATARSYPGNAPYHEPGRPVCAASEIEQCAEIVDFGHGIRKRCGCRREKGSLYCSLHQPK